MKGGKFMDKNSNAKDQAFERELEELRRQEEERLMEDECKKRNPMDSISTSFSNWINISDDNDAAGNDSSNDEDDLFSYDSNPYHHHAYKPSNKKISNSSAEDNTYESNKERRSDERWVQAVEEHKSAKTKDENYSKVYDSLNAVSTPKDSAEAFQKNGSYSDKYHSSRNEFSEPIPNKQNHELMQNMDSSEGLYKSSRQESLFQNDVDAGTFQNAAGNQNVNPYLNKDVFHSSDSALNETADPFHKEESPSVMEFTQNPEMKTEFLQENHFEENHQVNAGWQNFHKNEDQEILDSHNFEPNHAERKDDFVRLYGNDENEHFSETFMQSPKGKMPDLQMVQQNFSENNKIGATSDTENENAYKKLGLFSDIETTDIENASQNVPQKPYSSIYGKDSSEHFDSTPGYPQFGDQGASGKSEYHQNNDAFYEKTDKKTIAGSFDGEKPESFGSDVFGKALIHTSVNRDDVKNPSDFSFAETSEKKSEYPEAQDLFGESTYHQHSSMYSDEHPKNQSLVNYSHLETGRTEESDASQKRASENRGSFDFKQDSTLNDLQMEHRNIFKEVEQHQQDKTVQNDSFESAGNLERNDVQDFEKKETDHFGSDVFQKSFLHSSISEKENTPAADFVKNTESRPECFEQRNLFEKSKPETDRKGYEMPDSFNTKGESVAYNEKSSDFKPKTELRYQQIEQQNLFEKDEFDQKNVSFARHESENPEHFVTHDPEVKKEDRFGTDIFHKTAIRSSDSESKDSFAVESAQDFNVKEGLESRLDNVTPNVSNRTLDDQVSHNPDANMKKSERTVSQEFLPDFFSQKEDQNEFSGEIQDLRQKSEHSFFKETVYRQKDDPSIGNEERKKLSASEKTNDEASGFLSKDPEGIVDHRIEPEKKAVFRETLEDSITYKENEKRIFNSVQNPELKTAGVQNKAEIPNVLEKNDNQGVASVRHSDSKSVETFGTNIFQKSLISAESSKKDIPDSEIRPEKPLAEHQPFFDKTEPDSDSIIPAESDNSDKNSKNAILHNSESNERIVSDLFPESVTSHKDGQKDVFDLKKESESNNPQAEVSGIFAEKTVETQNNSAAHHVENRKAEEFGTDVFQRSLAHSSASENAKNDILHANSELKTEKEHEHNFDQVSKSYPDDVVPDALKGNFESTTGHDSGSMEKVVSDLFQESSKLPPHEDNKKEGVDSTQNPERQKDVVYNQEKRMSLDTPVQTDKAKQFGADVFQQSLIHSSSELKKENQISEKQHTPEGLKIENSQNQTEVLNSEPKDSAAHNFKPELNGAPDVLQESLDAPMHPDPEKVLPKEQNKQNISGVLSGSMFDSDNKDGFPSDNLKLSESPKKIVSDDHSDSILKNGNSSVSQAAEPHQKENLSGTDFFSQSQRIKNFSKVENSESVIGKSAKDDKASVSDNSKEGNGLFGQNEKSDSSFHSETMDLEDLWADKKQGSDLIVSGKAANTPEKEFLDVKSSVSKRPESLDVSNTKKDEYQKPSGNEKSFNSNKSDLFHKEILVKGNKVENPSANETSFENRDAKGLIKEVPAETQFSGKEVQPSEKLNPKSVSDVKIENLFDSSELPEVSLLDKQEKKSNEIQKEVQKAFGPADLLNGSNSVITAQPEDHKKENHKSKGADKTDGERVLSRGVVFTSVATEKSIRLKNGKTVSFSVDAAFAAGVIKTTSESGPRPIKTSVHMAGKAKFKIVSRENGAGILVDNIIKDPQKGARLAIDAKNLPDVKGEDGQDVKGAKMHSFPMVNLMASDALTTGSRITKRFITGTTRDLYGLTRGDPTKREFDKARFYLKEIPKAVAQSAVAFTAASLRATLPERLNPIFEKNGMKKMEFVPKNHAELQSHINRINRVLVKNGFEELTGTGAQIQAKIQKMLKEKDLSKDMIELLSAMGQLAENKTLLEFANKRNSSMRKIFRRIGNNFSSKLRQTTTGEGLFFALSIYEYVHTTLRMGIHFAASSTRAARTLINKQRKAHLEKLLNTLKKEKTSAKIARKQEKAAKDLKKLQGKMKKTKEQDIKRAAKKAKRDQMKEKLFDPFGLRKKWYNFKHTKFKKLYDNPFTRAKNKIAQALAHKFAGLIQAAGAISTYIWAFIGLLLMFVVIVAIVVNILYSLFSVYDAMFQTQDMREMVLETVKDEYEQQIQSIADLAGPNTEVKLKLKNIKTESVYKDFDAVNETTNSAEILAMTIVRYDFDLERYGFLKNEYSIKKYVRQLYKGSHTITKNVQSVMVGTNGEESIEKEIITVTLTTKYFDSIFDSTLSDSYITDAVLTGDSVSMQVWNYLIQQGFSKECAAGLLGNAQQESAMNPACDETYAKGLWQFEKSVGEASQLDKFAAERGTDWTDLKTQIDFLLTNLPSHFNQYTGRQPYYYSTGEWCWWPEKMTLEEYKQLDDVALATEIFERVFERASKPMINKRITYANEYYNKYKDLDPNSVGSDIIAYGSQFIGNPYVYGGNDLNNGIDCSGFVTQVLINTGHLDPKYYPRIVSTNYQNYGNPVASLSEAQPGDVIVWNGHVGFYAGNGQVLHAANPSAGIKMSDVSWAHDSSIIAIRRFPLISN